MGYMSQAIGLGKGMFIWQAFSIVVNYSRCLKDRCVSMSNIAVHSIPMAKI